MSYSSQTKEELCRFEPDSVCCLLAELSGIVCAAGSVIYRGGGDKRLSIETENNAVARRAFRLLREVFDVQPQLVTLKRSRLGGRSAYRIEISGSEASFVLEGCGIEMGQRRGVPREITVRKCCRMSFLRGVFLACVPALSLLASAVILKKKPTRRQVVGISITFLGVMTTVIAVGISSSLSPMGYAALMLAVAAYALYSVFADLASDYTGAEITYAMLLSGAAFYGLLALGEAAAHGTLTALLTLPVKNGAFRTAVLYQGVGCSVAAFFLSNAAIAKIGVNKTSSFIGVSTIVSILAGALALGEPLHIGQIVGAAVIVAGVYTANRT